MNCKQGDLALVVAGPSANVGKIVRCLELLPAGFKRDDLPKGVAQSIDPSVGPLWRTDRALSWGEQHLYPECHIAPDFALMPIRPPSGQDQGVHKTPVASKA